MLRALHLQTSIFMMINNALINNFQLWGSSKENGFVMICKSLFHWISLCHDAICKLKWPSQHYCHIIKPSNLSIKSSNLSWIIIWVKTTNIGMKHAAVYITYILTDSMVLMIMNHICAKPYALMLWSPNTMPCDMFKYLW